MPTIKFPKNPNTDTAFVEQDDGTKNRALMIAPQDISTLELPNNPNSTKGYITVDGKKQRVILTADITGGGGGGSGLPDQTGHSGEFLTTDGTDASWAAISALPDQTGNSGKFLTTDGTDASWSDKPLVNTATGNYSMCVGQTGSSASGTYSLAVGSLANSAQGSVAIGSGATTTANYTTAIGYQAGCYGGQGAVAIGSAARANAANAIQIAATNNVSVNSDTNTFKVANANGNFEIMSADGTIPTARFTTDPVADGTYYPTLTISSGTPTRSWSTISALQNTATDNSSLTILGTAATTWSSVNIGVSAVATDNLCTSVGWNAQARGLQSVAVGASSNAQQKLSVAIGSNAMATGLSSIAIGGSASASSAIQIGSGTNNTANTLCVGSFYNSIGNNWKLLDLTTGTIPTARLTKVNTTITLTAAGWSGGTTVTKTVAGITATGVVLVSPDPTDQADYTSAGILCTAQAADSLTFTATTTPTADIDVNVVML